MVCREPGLKNRENTHTSSSTKPVNPKTPKSAKSAKPAANAKITTLKSTVSQSKKPNPTKQKPESFSKAKHSHPNKPHTNKPNPHNPNSHNPKSASLKQPKQKAHHNSKAKPVKHNKNPGGLNQPNQKPGKPPKAKPVKSQKAKPVGLKQTMQKPEKTPKAKPPKSEKPTAGSPKRVIQKPGKTPKGTPANLKQPKSIRLKQAKQHVVKSQKTHPPKHIKSKVAKLKHAKQKHSPGQQIGHQSPKYSELDHHSYTAFENPDFGSVSYEFEITNEPDPSIPIDDESNLLCSLPDGSDASALDYVEHYSPLPSGSQSADDEENDINAYENEEIQNVMPNSNDFEELAVHEMDSEQETDDHEKDDNRVIPSYIIDFEEPDESILFSNHADSNNSSNLHDFDRSTVNPKKRLSEDYASFERKRQRMERFSSQTDSLFSPPPAQTFIDTSQGFRGTSQSLEKSYYRLTSEPNPANVRNEEVLKKCLPYVLMKFYSLNLLYAYINDQLKAIRQDLTIQHIKNELTMHVYQTHARIAIENDDLGEFNQCLSQLFSLYKANDIPEKPEFVLYRIIYMTLTGNNTEINKIRYKYEGVSASQIGSSGGDPFNAWIEPALTFSTAIICGDYYNIFRLYRQFATYRSTRLAFHLLNRHVVSKQRVMALSTMTKSFKRLPLSSLEEQLALDVDDIGILQYLKSHGLEHCLAGSDLECTSCKPIVMSILERGDYRKVDIKGQV
uniref:SAC3/GANP/THP3 conserved domain-containing protein n=1 Tax=Candidozyma auris TaxID=498019 RepID=A0A0L0P184_CANAR